MNIGWNCICVGVNLLVSDYSDLLKVIKKAAIDAVEAENPANICYGQVTSTSPLKILVDQKMTLTKMQLLVPEYLTDFEIDLKLKSGGTKQTYIAYGALKTGDNVILVREQGGQKYIVIDRMVT